jgi:fructose-1,6-bisphosphatase
VNRMYDAKVKSDAAEGAAAIQDAQQKMSDPATNEQMKAATGKSMQEIMSMSPEEQEAWAAEMEAKMGAGE